ncbi:Methyltransferase domain-containing protein [Pseudonocardia ammonioxydans]|uniref:Methyltransferase domain-containing protein n=1 Tax=Pseudonocardia ammonioxydans TaxID=260086 RepID=A0A1I5D4V9_PSUAM|nr:Methyltransferase domain-containing protein [Pseudonocardia ammonioxydans]
MPDSAGPAKGHRIFAAVYDRMSAPVEQAVLGPRRASLVGPLTGRVLDVGAGTGANLPHYRAADEVVALEPDPAMRRRLAARTDECRVPLTVDPSGADALPATDGSVDAVVFTLVLCTVPDPVRALAEARRVLRPGGRLVALEHVVGDGRPAVWRRRLAPLWSRIAAGCRLDRDTAATVGAAGFTLDEVEHLTVGPAWAPTARLVQLRATAAPASR